MNRLFIHHGKYTHFHLWNMQRSCSSCAPSVRGAEAAVQFARLGDWVTVKGSWLVNHEVKLTVDHI